MFGWIKRRQERRKRIKELQKGIDRLSFCVEEEKINQRFIELYERYSRFEHLKDYEYEELIDLLNKQSDLIIGQTKMLNEQTLLIISESRKHLIIAIVFALAALCITGLLNFIY